MIVSERLDDAPRVAQVAHQLGVVVMGLDDVSGASYAHVRRKHRSKGVSRGALCIFEGGATAATDSRRKEREICVLVCIMHDQ